MRLIRFVAVACMVAVSVASLGCGETATPAKPAVTSADTSGVTTPSDTEMAKTSTPGMTMVSLPITGMT